MLGNEIRMQIMRPLIWKFFSDVFLYVWLKYIVLIQKLLTII